MWNFTSINSSECEVKHYNHKVAYLQNQHFKNVLNDVCVIIVLPLNAYHIVQLTPNPKNFSFLIKHSKHQYLFGPQCDDTLL